VSFFDVAIVVGIAFVMGVNAALAVAIICQRAAAPVPQVAPRTLEIVVRSMFLGEVMQEERMLIDATVDEPVELTLLLDERDQVKEFL
jgi:hypothetical protein